MDNSPTTGSVTTTVAEKQQLAKSSLAFNCKNPTFRKMFPEYVQKYEEQQLADQPVPEQASRLPTDHQENSRPLLEKIGKDDPNKVEPPRDLKYHRKLSFPTWMLVLLVSVFGIVMALPLLQL
ncbi:Ubiquitin-conjugating enzyme E2 34 [Sarracenia purpurea var. burkii]